MKIQSKIIGFVFLLTVTFLVLVTLASYRLEACAPLREGRAAFLLMLAAGLLTIFALTRLALGFLVRRITAPLLSLIAEARGLRISAGAGECLTPSKGDELEELAAAVKALVGEMNQRQAILDENRELEKRLEEQRAFAESLLENTSTPLFVIDKQHRIIVWNRAIAELTGLPADAMLGTDRHWQAFYDARRPTLCDLVMDGLTEQIGGHYGTFSRDAVMEGMYRAEGWLPNLNGKDRYLFFDAAPVIKEGERIAVVETLYDITERVRAQESLRLFSRAVEQSASSIVITDTSGSIQYVNRKFCELTGYSPDEAMGANPRILQSGMEPDELYRDLWETVTSRHEWHGELHNRRKDGTLFWENALISPISDQNGNLTHFLGIKEDITARKDAERELLKKQAELVLKHEQLANLFRQVEKGKREWELSMDCVDDMVALADGEGLIRRCNRAFVELSACTTAQLHALRWDQLLREAGLDLDSLQGMSGELFHQASRRWLTLKTYRYGDGSGEVIMLHDLTQIKLVSEQLAAAYCELKDTHLQLLQQEKMASIGQLAAGVAHEINNPMGFISSNLGTMGKYLDRLTAFIELQSAGVDKAAPESLKKELAEARRRCKLDYILNDSRNLLAESLDGAERVRTIVQNLKSFSRVDETSASWVDLNQCLESTIAIAWNELKYKITLRRDFGELPAVKCLPQQLNQVFLNLLVNAAHAIRTQGEIAVGTRREGEQVVIVIHDTGSGIPAEIMSRIFEPFFTTKEVGKGTGLGLSISYDIIKKHHGTIEVESTPLTGTTFTIKLPIEGDRA
jgi:two-component system, NtrC family, sensor kinase